MIVADHNIVPGKKFFTWGGGSMWDKILTDNDGPYLEIMVGAYSDNQPDYSWLQPFEERSFVMNWYPFRGIDGVKKANLDAAINLDMKDGKAVFGFYTTKAYANATVKLTAGDKVLLQDQIAINPGKPYSKQLAIPAGIDEHDILVSLTAGGKELVAYSPARLEPIPKPESVPNVQHPSEIKNDEELFLAGQRIDQFHNPTLDADSYWEEDLKRDPGNVAANTGMGLLKLRNAEYVKAEQYFLTAIARLTSQYTTPKNVEPLYYLGVALKAQGRLDEAYTAYYKATWRQEWKSPAYFSLAEIAATKGDFTEALNLVNSSLDANALNVRAYGLKASILRHFNRNDEAIKLIAFAKEKCDPLDTQLISELWLASKDSKSQQTLFSTLINHPANAQEIAAGYVNCGLWSDGKAVLSQLITETPEKSNISPLVYYYLGFFAEKLGDTQQANEYRKQASLQPFEYVFPFQQEAIGILNSAIKANPSDAMAPYYLGNLLYDWQPEAAVALWEKSSILNPGLSITWRNLAIAYSHQKIKGSMSKAIACLEKAVNTANPIPTHFAELEQLYKSEGVSVEKRLGMLEKNQKFVIRNDEALGDMINLKNFAGKADEAISLLKSRIFSIWEGGNAFNTGQAWTDANLIRGLNYFAKKKYHEALTDFQTALTPPDNLRAQQGHNSRLVQIAYWTGCAYSALGEKDKAIKSWNEVVGSATHNDRTHGSGDGERRGFGNISQEQRYFIALAKRKLGSKDDADVIFRELAVNQSNSTSNSLGNEGDPQLVNADRMPSRDNLALPHYISGLGYEGLGNKVKAREELNAALTLSPDYLNAKIALSQL